VLERIRVNASDAGEVPRSVVDGIVAEHRLPARLYGRLWELVDLNGLRPIDLEVDEAPNDDDTEGWDGDGFGVFLTRTKHEVLSADQVIELAKRIETGFLARRALEQPEAHWLTTRAKRDLKRKQADGQLAKNEFAMANIRLVVSIASRFQGAGLPLEDLVQEGWFGLARAIEKFDYRAGFKFSTYATWWIRQSLQRSIENSSRTIRLPVHAADSLRRLLRLRRELGQRLGRSPTDEELAEASYLSKDTVQLLLRFGRRPASLDAPLGDGELRLADVIADPMFPDPQDEVERQDDLEFAHRLLEELDRRARQIMMERYGLDRRDGAPRTLDEVGALHGLTRERIRQIESTSLKRLGAKVGRKEER
jgi:RNA polymerase sigma factor (sigma-70 family)